MIGLDMRAGAARVPAAARGLRLPGPARDVTMSAPEVLVLDAGPVRGLRLPGPARDVVVHRQPVRGLLLTVLQPPKPTGPPNASTNATPPNGPPSSTQHDNDDGTCHDRHPR